MAENIARRLFQSPNGVSDVERGLAGIEEGGQSTNRPATVAQAPANIRLASTSTIDVLLCTEFKKIFTPWATYVYAGRKPKVVQIDSWKQLARTIEGFGRINELVLGFHGSPEGSVQIGNVVYPLGHPDLKELFKKSANIAANIEFLSCTVGLKPQALGEFARTMGARTVVGWTQFFAITPFDLNLTGKDDAEKIAAFIGRYGDYLPLNFPKTKKELEVAIRSLGAKPKVLPGVLEWFSFSPEIAVKDEFPKPDDPNFQDAFFRATNRKNKRSIAQEINLTSSDLTRSLALDLINLNRVKITMNA